MWIVDNEIIKDGNLCDNKGPQPMRGKTPLFLMSAASILIHTLALGLLCATLVNPFAWEADRQDSSVIQVTLSSLVANSVSRPTLIPSSSSRRGNINGDSSKGPYGVASKIQPASQPNPNKSNQESLSLTKTDSIDSVPRTISKVQLTPLSGEAMGRLDPATGSSTSASFGGPNRFAVTGEDSPVTKPRYAWSPTPAYPAAARSQGQEGVVLLSVEVQANGRTGRVLVKKSSGYALLDASALHAVRAWHFEPAKRRQTPETMTVAIPIRFSLKDNH